ncbi:MAG TPA: amidase [Solirubrobacterales bacterium]|nr:amidase [Solirubrobacterales bacterium]
MNAGAPPDIQVQSSAAATPNDDLGAFAWVDEGARGRRPAVAVKENIAVRGATRRAGSELLDPGPCAADAPVVAALRRAGYAVVGTTRMNELALGVTGDNHRSGPVINPRAPDRIAGGSSSGSAAAVAAGLCDVALGTDTGGSVRLPAALCGVVGLKPRRRDLSRAGVLVVSPTLDAVGILGGDVATVTKAFAVCSGGAQSVGGSPREPRLAVPAGWLEGVTADVLEPFLHLAAGAPEVEFAARPRLAAWAGTVSLYEASRSLAELVGDPRLGPDADLLLTRGAAISADDYAAALAGREQARARLAAIFAEVDALVLPTVPESAPLRGSDAAVDRDRLTGWARPFNLTDSAAVSVPLPTTGPPTAIQVVAASPSQALTVAAWLESRSTSRSGGIP